MFAAELGLCASASLAAQDFELAFDTRVRLLYPQRTWLGLFTSGCRIPEQQAEAMAENVALNTAWIEQTYKSGPVTTALQAAVYANPECSDFAALLLGVLKNFPAWQLARFSGHLAAQGQGRAFDVRPICEPSGVTPSGGLVSDAELVQLGAEASQWLAARAAAVGGKFLTREGGLVRWHWQAAMDD